MRCHTEIASVLKLDRHGNCAGVVAAAQLEVSSTVLSHVEEVNTPFPACGELMPGVEPGRVADVMRTDDRSTIATCQSESSSTLSGGNGGSGYFLMAAAFYLSKP